MFGCKLEKECSNAVVGGPGRCCGVEWSRGRFQTCPYQSEPSATAHLVLSAQAAGLPTPYRVRGDVAADSQ